MPQPSRLVDRTPDTAAGDLLAAFVPPRQFHGARIENYQPDPAHPSQAAARDAVAAFAQPRAARGGLFSRRRAPEAKPGIYLDGGFGVGKTHLLAALWHATSGRRTFGTFIEYTALVGALGYAEAVRALTGTALIAIDEFELDDPGDTMLMSRLLGDLVASGSRVAATSNTPPNALGEGRFAAADFLREINRLAGNFDTLRIDGPDYRRRDLSEQALVADAAALDGLEVAPSVTLDGFDDVIRHLGTVHPAKYVRLVTGLRTVGLRDVHVLDDQADALRLVAFVDRLYDAQVRLVATGVPLDRVFGERMLEGGYRKKYLRAVSRMVALTHLAPADAAARP